MYTFHSSLEDINYIINKYNRILDIANAYDVSIRDIPESLIGFAILYDNLRLVEDFCSKGVAFYNPSVGWRKHD